LQGNALDYKLPNGAKGKWIPFSPVHDSINIIKPLQRKTMFNFTPGSVPFNPKLFVFSAFFHVGISSHNS
jgi:hypothetical protein